MLYLRPQRVYKPSTYTLFDPNEFVLDLTNATYRLRIETPRGTSITEDNSQITCYAHIFLKKDGSQLTERLKERGFRPTWLLDNKPIDSARVSEDGYKLTFETSHLPAILQTVTLQARDTDILLALTDDPMIRRLLQAAIDSGFRSSTLIETSEKLLDACSWDKLINQLKQDLTESIKTNTDTLSELLKHPLTVSKDGYWRIWDALKKTYVTTEYQSRGEKGEPGDKGDTPVMTLDSNLRLLADGKLLSPVSLRGEPGQSPNPEDVAEDVVDTSRFQQLLTEHIDTSLTSKMQPLQRDLSRLSSATRGMANELQSQLCERMVLGISDQGYLKVNDSCSNSAYDFDFLEPGQTIPHQRNTTREIRLTMYSDYEELEARVASLSRELKELQATNTITPISDAYQRCEYNFITRERGRTIYPKYGDWILSSDAEEQQLSFAGLNAEIGRSIYIQTRKDVYLFANGHAFYGLPGDERRGVRIDQWLSHNTTYRFLRASSDTWFVTASSSPYPWT